MFLLPSFAHWCAHKHCIRLLEWYKPTTVSTPHPSSHCNVIVAAAANKIPETVAELLLLFVAFSPVSNENKCESTLTLLEFLNISSLYMSASAAASFRWLL